ncbi:tRNA (adenine(58)-N(1))-methyltransferase non-catalytic subunit TRM6 [Planococcus citri]|uniref:tRNA (adenine(58)-N(1))-methyltransferase non-catalytic subunit TRM6 n=1 Tax=Planococcus citri TaxID=170843 RepID=UPI0031F93BB8
MELQEDGLGIIRVKDHIILTRGEDHMLCQIENNKPRVKFFNTPIDLCNIIDKPFWSIFRMERVKHDNYYRLLYCDPSQVNVSVVESTEKGLDNRSIEDDNNAQGLSKEEILDMKSNGQSSNEILSELIKNSKSFHRKTEFAQEKYVKKKSKKYSDFIQVLKPDIRLLAKVLLRGNVTAVPFMGLGVETLTQIRTSLSLQPDGKYIIYENNCHGLIIAFLLKSLGPEGKLLNVITPNYPFNKLKAVKAMQFSQEKQSQMMHIRSCVFLKYSKYHGNIDSDFNTDTDANEDNPKRKNNADDKAREKRTKDLEQQSEEVRKLTIELADGLVFACREIVTSSHVATMLQFLAPSRPFVVYCQWKEPLVKLFNELKQRNDVTCLRIFENSSRIYQVLPERTHPNTMMSSSSGYLLTGFTIECEEGSNAVKPTLPTPNEETSEANESTV